MNCFYIYGYINFQYQNSITEYEELQGFQPCNHPAWERVRSLSGAGRSALKVNGDGQVPLALPALVNAQRTHAGQSMAARCARRLSRPLTGHTWRALGDSVFH